jgi:radical SAM superfamily enzyme YgiQ (UPF0313 family)
MRIILINPPIVAEFGENIYLPINLAYIAALLEENHHEIEIIDLQIECRSIKKLIERIKKFNPELIGITSVTPTFPYALKLAELFKKVKKDMKIVLGGIHVTAMPEDTLKNDCVDFVVIGEGEKTIVELADAIEKNKNFKKIRGLGFKENGKIIINPPRPLIKNLDDLPLPAYHLINMKEYKYPRGIVPFFTSRGCPFNCIFCASHLVNGKKIRRRSIANVIEELKLLKKYGVNYVSFFDDTFTIDRKYVIKLCEQMIKENLNFKWWCNTRVSTVDEELLTYMKKAGCRIVAYGFESGTQRILNYIKKGITLEQSKRAAEIAKKLDMEMDAFFIINFPTEKKEEIINTIRFARTMPFGWFRLSSATPYPGTELYNICRKNNYVSEEKLFNWANYNYLKGFYIYNPEITERDLKKLLKKSDLKLLFTLTCLKTKFIKVLRDIVEGDFNTIKRNIKLILRMLSI